MKNCGNKDCFWSRTANEILQEDKAQQVIKMIRTKGMCDNAVCLNYLPTKLEKVVDIS